RASAPVGRGRPPPPAPAAVAPARPPRTQPPYSTVVLIRSHRHIGIDQSTPAIFSGNSSVFSQHGLALLAGLVVDCGSCARTARPGTIRARVGGVPAGGPGPRGVAQASAWIEASPRAARPGPPRPARHGTCRWHVSIAPAGQTGGKLYAVIPLGAQPGFRGTWRLNVQESHPAQSYTVAAPKSGRPGCTCPDHETRGTMCKHIRALAPRGLVRLPQGN